MDTLFKAYSESQATELTLLKLRDLRQARSSHDFLFSICQITTLKSLSIEHISIEMGCLDFLLGAGFRHNLKHLSLINTMELPSIKGLFQQLLDQFKNLETLAINCEQSFFDGMPKEPQSLRKLELRSGFEIESSSINNIDLLRFCPKLTHLSMPIRIDETGKPRIDGVPCQSLTDLTINSRYFNLYIDTIKATLIESIRVLFPKLKNLTVNGQKITIMLDQ